MYASSFAGVFATSLIWVNVQRGSKGRRAWGECKHIAMRHNTESAAVPILRILLAVGCSPACAGPHAQSRHLYVWSSTELISTQPITTLLAALCCCVSLRCAVVNCRRYCQSTLLRWLERRCTPPTNTSLLPLLIRAGLSMIWSLHCVWLRYTPVLPHADICKLPLMQPRHWCQSMSGCEKHMTSFDAAVMLCLCSSFCGCL